MPIDQASLTAAGQKYGIPPAILFGISQQGPMPNFGQMVENYGFKQSELDANPQLAAQVMAMALADMYSKYGSWESAISAYASGDPNQFQNITSGIGGYVIGTLAVAAANADMGLNQQFGANMDPRNMDAWNRMSQDFGSHIDRFSQQGGVITSGMAQNYRLGVAVSTQALVSGMQRSSDKHYPISQFDAHPFDPKYMRQESENFGWGGSEIGNDYGMPNAQPLTAAMSGTVSVRAFAGKLDTFIRISDGPMAGWEIGYGHMSSVSVKDGQVVKAGQQIGLSGGTPGDPNAGISTGSHLEFQLRDPQGLWHDPQPLLAATEGVPGSMGSNAMGGPGGQTKQKPPDPDAAAIDKFAAEAKRIGLSPNDFQEAERYAKAVRRQGLQPDNMEKFAQTKGMDDPTMLAHIGSQVHPAYPDVTVGDFNRTQSSADMYALLHTHSTSHGSDVVRFLKSGANLGQIQDYYKQAAAAEQSRNQAGQGALA